MKIITIGTNKNNDYVVENDSTASRKHAQLILHDDGTIAISDLGSTNGTFVNGQKITNETILRKGDRVEVGRSTVHWEKYQRSPINPIWWWVGGGIAAVALLLAVLFTGNNGSFDPEDEWCPYELARLQDSITEAQILKERAWQDSIDALREREGRIYPPEWDPPTIPDPEIKDSIELHPCNTFSTSGGDEGFLRSFEMGQQSGSFLFQFNTQNVPDQIRIFDGAGTAGRVIFTYAGGTRGWINVMVRFNEPTITIEVVSLGHGTVWCFIVNCPE